MESRGEHEAETHIRDPVYDEVGLSSLEIEILDQPEVQRLRQVKQLGAVHRVYPSATHTRFSHSIGVMHLSGLLANKVGLKPEEITQARIAGLLHDTGHGPFSHTSEEVVGEEVFNHEERSAEIAKSICSDLPVDGNEVADYILGNKSPSIVAGIIDSDRLDYMVRDSIFSSVDHGRIDVHSIVRFSTEIDGELAFEEKAVPSMNDMLSARLRMRKVVYRYPTVRHFSTLIKRAMEEYLHDNTVEDLVSHDDYTMHSKMIDNQNEYYRQVIERDLSRNRFSFDHDDLDRNQLRSLSRISDTDIRSYIADSIGAEEDSILVSPPYIPKNIPDKTKIIGSDGTIGTLSDFSDYPSYLYQESWSESSFCVYLNKDLNVDRDQLLNSIVSISDN